MSYDNKDMHIQGPQINQFNNISPKAIPRSAFRRDFTRRTTFDTDLLIPIFVDEVLPGDDLSLSMTALLRMSTPIKPLMDNLYFETFWFFVPNRLVWSNWEKFQGEQVNPGDSVAYQIPILDKTKAPLSTTGFTNQSIYDYFGLPTRVSAIDDISALYNRAYDLIWTEWFRDENLQNSIVPPSGDGPDDPAIYTLRKRNKRKDYITSGLPWPQKGSAVSISLGGRANVLGLGSETQVFSTGTVPRFQTGGTSAVFPFEKVINPGTPNAAVWMKGTAATGGYPDVYADLSSATPITINALRQAALYQQILELDARGGTRYVESIFSRFGVISPDFRLQRPELIGQGHSRINIYAVPQTAPTVTGQTAQGNLAAFGTAQIQNGHSCRYSATEHGMVIGIGNIRADLTYQQALPRMFTRRTRLDFYEPLLNGLGEQAVLNRELMAQGTSADKDVLNYQERFAEYRFKQSEVTGKFRSNDPQSLQIWHLSQSFATLPGFNSSFIEETVPIARVLAVSNEPAFLGDFFYQYLHVRPMPIRSNPGIRML